MFHCTYVLKCGDGKLYIGYTSDLKRRINQHKQGLVKTTKSRFPIELIYYEACLSEEQAKKREKYFKTGFGRKFLKSRI